MAVRSGAGTGVVVSLVVFILTTFFLLILTIVFYSKQTKALEAEDSAEKTLATYIKATERNTSGRVTAHQAAMGEPKSCPTTAAKDRWPNANTKPSASRTTLRRRNEARSPS